MRFGKKKTFIDHAAEFAESALESLESAYESAKETAVPVLSDAKDRAVPLLDQGRTLAAEKGSAAAAVARERAAAGAALAASQASSGRDLAAARVARLRREPEPKGGKLKKFLLVTGLLALGGIILKSVRDRQANDNWQSSYVPPASAPAAPSTAGVPLGSPADGLANPLTDPLPGSISDDPGGAGPDEAMSDAVDSPHPVTTPDQPADVIDLDDEDSKRL